MATATNEADQIRRQMALIRRELHEDVREVVASAEAVTDWHRYLRMYPWAALGVAFAVGYLVVPRRHKALPEDLAALAEVTKARGVVREKEKEKAKEATRKGLVATALGMLAPVAVRAAQSYAVKYLEEWIAQQQMSMMGAGPLPQGHPQSQGGPGRPGGMPGL